MVDKKWLMVDKKNLTKRGRQSKQEAAKKKLKAKKRLTKSGRVQEADKKMQTVKTSKSQKEADS